MVGPLPKIWLKIVGNQWANLYILFERYDAWNKSNIFTYQMKLGEKCIYI